MAFDPGLAVGEPAPVFGLPDHGGAVRQLADLCGRHGLVVVFIRSAAWCPFCKMQLAQLVADSDRIALAGLGIAAVSKDSVDVFRTFANAVCAPFPLLSDSEGRFIREAGLRNEQISIERSIYGIPYTGLWVLDSSGIIREKEFQEDYRYRPRILESLQKMGKI